MFTFVAASWECELNVECFLATPHAVDCGAWIGMEGEMELDEVDEGRDGLMDTGIEEDKGIAGEFDEVANGDRVAI